jgi:hypothetical protein
VHQRGLETLDQDSGEDIDVTKESDPSVDGFVSPDSSTFKLQLVISIAGLWQPTYDFHLKAIKLDDIEVVKSHLRDAMEEIKTLKAGKTDKPAHAFLSLTSSTPTAYQQIVPWNGPKGLQTSSHFDISADNRTISIKHRGVYQIHCRLGQSSNGNGHCIGLLIDGAEIAQCLQSDANNYQNTAQITEILEVAAGAALTVRCGANSNSLGAHLQNRLSVVLLQAM